ncbi:Cullin [Mycena olivaceomarginata]|nr:Cullin [Mycena olivaceomarginata]
MSMMGSRHERGALVGAAGEARRHAAEEEQQARGGCGPGGGVMVLFKYLEAKDVFQTFYTTKLSKRLIHGVSASDEAEASMISKLKEACGFEHLSLERSFKERMAQNHDNMDIAFSIMLLPTFERFTRYYQTKHSGRKFTWLHNYSKNELRTNYTNQKYILMTSAYQMSFKSKNIRVNLNLLIKADVKAGSSDVLKAVDEDRKYVIQATIVGIMKISQRFAPKIPDIKKAIEEKEYIERVDGSKDTFAYVA